MGNQDNHSGIHIQGGATVETIDALATAILAVLAAGRGDSVTEKALDVLMRGTSVSNVAITGNSIRMGVAADEPIT